MAELSFFVPIEPRGKPRPRFNRHGGAFNHPLVKHVETVVREHAEEAMAFLDVEPLDGPLHLSLRVAFRPPGSWSAKRQEAAQWHTVKPDADNLLKMVCDALNGVAYRDDAAICSGDWAKVYTRGAEGFTVSLRQKNPTEGPR